jgi:hypothetical protein
MIFEKMVMLVGLDGKETKTGVMFRNKFDGC